MHPPKQLKAREGPSSPLLLLYIPIPKVSSFLPAPSSTQRNGIQTINTIFSPKLSRVSPKSNGVLYFFSGILANLSVGSSKRRRSSSFLDLLVLSSSVCVCCFLLLLILPHFHNRYIGRRKEGREEGVAFIAQDRSIVIDRVRADYITT